MGFSNVKLSSVAGQCGCCAPPCNYSLCVVVRSCGFVLPGSAVRFQGPDGTDTTLAVPSGSTTGAVTLSNPAAGDWTVTVSHDGFVTQVMTPTIVQCGSQTIVVYLSVSFTTLHYSDDFGSVDIPIGTAIWPIHSGCQGYPPSAPPTVGCAGTGRYTFDGQTYTNAFCGYREEWCTVGSVTTIPSQVLFRIVGINATGDSLLIQVWRWVHLVLVYARVDGDPCGGHGGLVSVYNPTLADTPGFAPGGAGKITCVTSGDGSNGYGSFLSSDGLLLTIPIMTPTATGTLPPPDIGTSTLGPFAIGSGPAYGYASCFDQFNVGDADTHVTSVTISLS